MICCGFLLVFFNGMPIFHHTYQYLLEFVLIKLTQLYELFIIQTFLYIQKNLQLTTHSENQLVLASSWDATEKIKFKKIRKTHKQNGGLHCLALMLSVDSTSHLKQRTQCNTFIIRRRYSSQSSSTCCTQISITQRFSEQQYKYNFL